MLSHNPNSIVVNTTT